jgi:hypothetical protein
MLNQKHFKQLIDIIEDRILEFKNEHSDRVFNYGECYTCEVMGSCTCTEEIKEMEKLLKVLKFEYGVNKIRINNEKI